jgi:hypothetical protein
MAPPHNRRFGCGLSVKNAGSERVVPCTPIWSGRASSGSLLRRKRRVSLASSDLKQNTYGRWTAKWGEWFGSYLRGVCGVTDRDGVSLLPHTFKHYARHVKMIEGVQRQIMGHGARMWRTLTAVDTACTNSSRHGAIPGAWVQAPPAPPDRYVENGPQSASGSLR